MADIRLEDRTITVRKGQSVLEALIAGGVLLRSDCGGKGRCAKCRVRIVTANPESVTTVDKTEAANLAQDDIDTGIRLACRVSRQNMHSGGGSSRCSARGIQFVQSCTHETQGILCTRSLPSGDCDC